MAPVRNLSTNEIMDFLNEGVVIIKDGKIAYSNQSFLDLSDVDKKNVLGIPFLDFVSDYDKKRVGSYLGDLVSFNSNGSDRVEFSLVDRLGNESIFEMKVRTIPYEMGIGVLGSLNDITERRKTRRKLEKLLDIIPEVVLVADSIDPTKILKITNATEKLCAIPAEEFMTGALHIFDIVHSNDSEKVIDFYKNILDNEFDVLEYQIVSADGSEKWVNDSAEVIYKHGGKGRVESVIHVIRDVTERKMYVEKLSFALDNLRISEERYREIVENSSDAIYTVTPEGNFKQMNSAGVNLFGFNNLENALNSNIKDYYLDLEQRKYVLNKINTEGEIVDYSLKIKTTSGDIRDVVITAGAKKNKNTGELESYQVIIHDITCTLHEKEIETYRRTMKGLADSINNLSQIYSGELGLMEDYVYDLKRRPENFSDNLESLLETAGEFKNNLKRLIKLGEMARNAYSEPPEASSDGMGQDMYYFDTR